MAGGAKLQGRRSMWCKIALIGIAMLSVAPAQVEAAPNREEECMKEINCIATKMNAIFYIPKTTIIVRKSEQHFKHEKGSLELARKFLDLYLSDQCGIEPTSPWQQVPDKPALTRRATCTESGRGMFVILLPDDFVVHVKPLPVSEQEEAAP